jgi:large subunit ribosomal protein L9
MKVVFMEEVEGTARVGEIKNVADGFARNYLLPRRLAAPATDHYVAIAQARAEKEARRQERLDDEARVHLLPKMEGRSVTIEVRVGEQGKLFGSVTARDIAEALQAATSIEVEHRQVDLRQPIRDLGAHEVMVKLTRNVLVPVTVNVEALGGLPEEAVTEEAEAAEEPAAEAESEAVAEEAAAAEAAEEPTEEAAAELEAVEEAEAAEEPAAEAESEAVAEEAAAAEAAEEPTEEAAAELEAVEEAEAAEVPAAEAEPEAAAEEAEAEEPEEVPAVEEPTEEAEAAEEPEAEAVEGGQEET